MNVGSRDSKLHELFAKIAISVTTSLSEESVIAEIMNQVEFYFQPDNWSLFKIDPETNSLYFAIAKGLDINQVKDVRIPFGEGIVGTVAKNREPLLIADVKSSIYFSPKMDSLTGFITKSIIAVPIIYQNKTMGVIELINKIESNAFSQLEMEILRTIADFSAIAIINSQNYQQLAQEIKRREEIENEMVVQHQNMLVISRRAGMADVATSVLHNVGNILNSANVSVNIVADNINNASLNKLQTVQSMLEAHSDNINEYLTNDEKGKLIIKYLVALIPKIAEIHTSIKNESEHLSKNLDNIRQIISIENDVGGKVEMNSKIFIPDLFDNAIALCFPKNIDNHIEIVKDYNVDKLINTDKIKIMQILVNLIKNSKESLDSIEGNRMKRITLSCRMLDTELVELSVMDNGSGIKPDVLSKMFTFGVTTKEKGHGYGMHNSYLGAKELHGDLTVASDGVDKGAKFTLTIMSRPTE